MQQSWGLACWVHGAAWLIEQIRRATAPVGVLGPRPKPRAPVVCSSALWKWRRARGAFILPSGAGAFCFLARQTRCQAAQVPVAGRIKEMCLQGCRMPCVQIPWLVFLFLGWSGLLYYSSTHVAVCRNRTCGSRALGCMKMAAA